MTGSVHNQSFVIWIFEQAVCPFVIILTCQSKILPFFLSIVLINASIMINKCYPSHTWFDFADWRWSIIVYCGWGTLVHWIWEIPDLCALLCRNGLDLGSNGDDAPFICGTSCSVGMGAFISAGELDYQCSFRRHAPGCLLLGHSFRHLWQEAGPFFDLSLSCLVLYTTYLCLCLKFLLLCFFFFPFPLK